MGNFAHIVADLDRSLGFYRDVLGLEVTNGVLHAVFVQDPDGFVVEMLEAQDVPAGAPHGDVIAGSAFEAAVRDSEESVKFYNDLLGFDLKLGTASVELSRRLPFHAELRAASTTLGEPDHRLLRRATPRAAVAAADSLK